MRGNITRNQVLFIAHIEKEVDKKTQSGIIYNSTTSKYFFRFDIQ